MGDVIFLQLSKDELRNLIREELYAHSRIEATEAKRPIVIRDTLSLKEACEFTGLCESTMYTMVSKRTIPHYKPGRNLVFKRVELEVWMNSRKRKTRL